MDGAQASNLFGRPVIVVPTAIITSSGAEDRAFLGDLTRAVLVYRRQNIVAESSRDAEFALDNTLFRFGWRFDVAIVEGNQLLRFGTP